MASSSEVARLTKGVMSYMGEISEQNFRVTRIASSAEFKSFLYHLSERAPLPMRELLSSATLKCEDALRVQKDDRRAKKKAAQSNENERTSKRVKITHPGEEETSPSQRVAESDLMAQVRDYWRLSVSDTNPRNSRDVLTLLSHVPTLLPPTMTVSSSNRRASKSPLTGPT